MADDSPELAAPTSTSAKNASDPHVMVQPIKNDKAPIGGVQLGAMRRINMSGNMPDNVQERVERALRFNPTTARVDKAARAATSQLKLPPPAQINQYVQSRTIATRLIQASLKRQPNAQKLGLLTPQTTNSVVLENVLAGNAEASHQMQAKLLKVAQEHLRFHKTVSSTYMKHALTLQFQHLAATKDTTTVMRGFAEMVENKLEAIKINTKLPDLSKLGFFQSMVNDATNAVAGFALGIAKKYGEELVTKKAVPGLAKYLEGARPHIDVRGHVSRAASATGAFIRKSPLGARTLDALGRAGTRAGESFAPLARAWKPATDFAKSKLSDLDARYHIRETLDPDKLWKQAAGPRAHLAKILRNLVTKEDKVANLLKEIRDQGLRRQRTASSQQGTPSASGVQPQMHQPDAVNVDMFRGHMSSLLNNVHPDHRDHLQKGVDDILETFPHLSPDEQRSAASKISESISSLAQSTVVGHNEISKHLTSDHPTPGFLSGGHGPVISPRPVHRSDAYRRLEAVLKRSGTIPSSGPVISNVGMDHVVPTAPPHVTIPRPVVPSLDLEQPAEVTPEQAASPSFMARILNRRKAKTEDKNAAESAKLLKKIYDLLVTRLPKPLRKGGLRDHDQREANDLLRRFGRRGGATVGGIGRGFGFSGGSEGGGSGDEHHDDNDGPHSRGWFSDIAKVGVGGALWGGAKYLGRKGIGAVGSLGKAALRRIGLMGPADVSAEAVLGAAETAGKVGLREGAMAGGRALPAVGLALGTGDALYRFSKGDFTGGALSGAAGLSALIPFIGTATSIGLSGLLIKHDIDSASKDYTKRSIAILQSAKSSQLFVARIKAYGADKSQIKATLDVESQIYDNVKAHRNPMTMTQDELKSFAKSFGFDPSNAQQLQYFKLWLNHRLFAAFSTYLQILRQFHQAPETEDAIPPKEVKEIIFQYDKLWKTIEPQYAAYAPTMRAFQSFIGHVQDPLLGPRTPGSAAPTDQTHPSLVPSDPSRFRQQRDASPFQAQTPGSPAPTAPTPSAGPTPPPTVNRTITPTNASYQPTANAAPGFTLAAYHPDQTTGNLPAPPIQMPQASELSYGVSPTVHLQYHPSGMMPATAPPSPNAPHRNMFLPPSSGPAAPAAAHRNMFLPPGAAPQIIQGSGKTTASSAQQIQNLKRAMDAQGITDPQTRAGIMALAGGEGGFKPRSETSYAHTSNQRLRMLFPSSLAGMSDAQLTQLKSSDQAMFDAIYGGRKGQELGNTQKDDGYKYRGRGDIQLTGKANYAKYGKLAGVDLINHPDLMNDPMISAKVTVAYMKDRYHGGGFAAMKRAVGNSVGGPDATKNRLFAQYMQSGEMATPATPQSTQLAAANTNAPTLPGTGEWSNAAGTVTFTPVNTSDRIVTGVDGGPVMSAAAQAPVGGPSPQIPSGTQALGMHNPQMRRQMQRMTGNTQGGAIQTTGPNGQPLPPGQLPINELPKGAVGSGQCVDLVKKATGLGATATWQKGSMVLGNPNLKPGTPIACFDSNGKYGNHTNGTSHAAIYLGPSLTKPGGIRVYDQWAGHPAQIRDIGLTSNSPVDNAKYFSVIDTAKGPAPNAFHDVTPAAKPGAQGDASGQGVKVADPTAKPPGVPKTTSSEPQGAPATAPPTGQQNMFAPPTGAGIINANATPGTPLPQPTGMSSPAAGGGSFPSGGPGPMSGGGPAMPSGPGGRRHRNMFSPPNSPPPLINQAASPGGGSGGQGANDNPPPGGSQLGTLSSHFESGSRGSMAMAPDTGNTYSYGKYQINSKTMPAFIKWAASQGPNGAAVAKALSSAGNSANPNGGFGNAWKQMVSSGSMGDLEHGFIKSTHYDVAFSKLSPEMKARVEKSPALQQVLWSTAVQHGPGLGIGAAGIFNKVGGSGQGSDQDLIKGIYQERIKHFSNPTTQAQQAKRFAQESQMALNIAKQPVTSPTTPSGTTVALAKPGNLAPGAPATPAPSPDGTTPAPKSPAAIQTAMTGDTDTGTGTPTTTSPASPSAAATPPVGGGDTSSTTASPSSGATPSAPAPTDTSPSPAATTPPSGDGATPTPQGRHHRRRVVSPSTQPGGSPTAPATSPEFADASMTPTHRETAMAEEIQRHDHQRRMMIPPGLAPFFPQLGQPQQPLPVAFPPEVLAHNRRQVDMHQQQMAAMTRMTSGIDALHNHFRGVHAEGGLFGQIATGIKDVSKAGTTIFSPMIQPQPPQPQNQDSHLGLNVRKKREPRYAV